jgi:hypothetical protein
MSNIVNHIIDNDYVKANEVILESIANIVERKMCEMKKKVAAQLTELPHDIRMKRLRMDVLEEKDDEDEDEKEDEKEDDEDGEKEDLHEAPRISIVKARIRGGKIQRRKKVSNVPGMTMRGGQLKRMTASERRRRKLGAVKAARKSKAKRTQMLRKRKISLMKRQRLGI